MTTTIKLDGKLAITITSNDDYPWQLTARENETTYSHIGESSIFSISNNPNKKRSFHNNKSVGIITELSWSHYRLIMKIDDKKRREFYMHESVDARGSVRQPERQINSFYYERLVVTDMASRDEVRSEIQTLEPNTTPDYILKIHIF